MSWFKFSISEYDVGWCYWISVRQFTFIFQFPLFVAAWITDDYRLRVNWQLKKPIHFFVDTNWDSEIPF
jgi:hypothetical protein